MEGMNRRARQTMGGLSSCPFDMTPKAPSSRGALAPISVCATLTPFFLFDLPPPLLLVVCQDHLHQDTSVLIHYVMHAAR